MTKQNKEILIGVGVLFAAYLGYRVLFAAKTGQTTSGLMSGSLLGAGVVPGSEDWNVALPGVSGTDLEYWLQNPSPNEAVGLTQQDSMLLEQIFGSPFAGMR